MGLLATLPRATRGHLGAAHRALTRATRGWLQTTTRRRRRQGGLFAPAEPPPQPLYRRIHQTLALELRLDQHQSATSERHRHEFPILALELRLDQHPERTEGVLPTPEPAGIPAATPAAPPAPPAPATAPPGTPIITTPFHVKPARVSTQAQPLHLQLALLQSPTTGRANPAVTQRHTLTLLVDIEQAQETGHLDLPTDLSDDDLLALIQFLEEQARGR